MNGKNSSIRVMMFLAVLAICVIAGVVGMWNEQRTAVASEPVFGSVSAISGAAVTAGQIVKLSADRTIVAASANTDKTVGVCELTCTTTGQLTRYAPMGSSTSVTIGGTVVYGDLVTCDTSGRAVALTLTGTGVYRYVGMITGSSTVTGASVGLVVNPGITGYTP